MKEENCPCCPKENLSCGHGREYFNGNSGEPESLNEQVIMDLRQCGHLLHHNKEIDTAELLSNFSKEELAQLHQLLSKICKSK